MKLLNRVERLIYESPAWKFLLIVISIVVFRTGIWYIPNIDASLAMAQNPFVNPFTDPDAHYLFWSWLGPFVSWVIGLRSKLALFVFHLVFSAAFWLLYLRIAFVHLSARAARNSIVLFAVLPVSATSLFWVGVDSISLFLIMTALAFPRSAVIAVGVGLLLGMQHFEQGFFAAGGLCFAVGLSYHWGGVTTRYSLRFCAGFLFGVVVGKLVLFGLFDVYSIAVNSGRFHWLAGHLGLLVSLLFFHFHFIAWSVLGVGWLIAFRYADIGRGARPFFAALLGLCLLLPVSGDQTRVLAIVTFPLLAAYWLFNQDFLEKLSKKEVSLLFVIWTITPWGFFWGGSPKWSAFPYDLAYALHNLFGWFSPPQPPDFWPFLYQ